MLSNMNEIESLGTKPTVPNFLKLKHILLSLVAAPEYAYTSTESLHKALVPLQRIYKIVPSKYALGRVYRQLLTEGVIAPHPSLQALLVHKSVRSESGILNITVSMPPDTFSCKYNCYFCPNEPGMPRSYLSNEDVLLRAGRVGFDTVDQVYSRLDTLRDNGHEIDKLEFRVLGGTFSCYDHGIADVFIRDLYYAANTYRDRTNRPRETLEEEQVRNETATVHVVGLGVETRPDEITDAELVRFRRYGVTRVELGIQHTDDALLRKVNRGHGLRASKKAIRLLKDYGFKVEIHIMTDLPGATPEGDRECYRQVLQTDPDLLPDYMKDYPCMDVSFTKIKEWKAAGLWQPYAERSDARELKDVLIYRQEITPRWVRVNRVQRDFRRVMDKPGHEIGYESKTLQNCLAQIVKDEAEARGVYCQCIRCCEIRGESFRPEEIQYRMDRFAASGTIEYFLSAVIPREPRNLLLGFLRLRMPSAHHKQIPELNGAVALIRELHVYGKVQQVGTKGGAGSAQHLGIGRTLLCMVEDIAASNGAESIAIISGIGVREYYKKHGFRLEGTYMFKHGVRTALLRRQYIILTLLCALLISLVLLE
jgi:ELP3 family radical SAM enzyme/protein acetyltransferase